MAEQTRAPAAPAAEDQEVQVPLVRYEMPTDPVELAALTGFLILPRIRGIKYSVDTFAQKCAEVDAAHGTNFAGLVSRPSDEEAFKRAVQGYGTAVARLEQVKLPAADPRVKYSWCKKEQSGEDVSAMARAWIEFRRAAKGSTSGTIAYSKEADGCPLPLEVAGDFLGRFNAHLVTMNTADMRVFVSEVLARLGGKNLGKNIWFAPVGTRLGAFSAVINIINTAAGYSAVVLFEITKTGHNATMGKAVVSELFAKELEEATAGLEEYKADLALYEQDPKAHKMRFRSRAKKSIADLSQMLETVELYGDLLEEQVVNARKKVEKLRANWRTSFNAALVAAECFEEALHFNADNKRPFAGVKVNDSGLVGAGAVSADDED